MKKKVALILCLAVVAVFAMAGCTNNLPSGDVPSSVVQSF